MRRSLSRQCFSSRSGTRPGELAVDGRQSDDAHALPARAHVGPGVLGHGEESHVEPGLGESWGQLGHDGVEPTPLGGHPTCTEDGDPNASLMVAAAHPVVPAGATTLEGVSGRPAGWVWKVTSRATAKSRTRRFELFQDLMEPDPDDSILDVGITDSPWRSGNPLELNYAYPDRITAVSISEPLEFSKQHPEVTVVVADGRALPFPDDSFDIGFSNAVVEHVGSREQQRRFVHEMVRTCRRSMIATPNAVFPIDPHTLLPFVHWLPRRLRHPVLRWAGNSQWASEDALNPLTERGLRSLFPDDANVRIVRQRVLGLTTVLIAVARR